MLVEAALDAVPTAALAGDTATVVTAFGLSNAAGRAKVASSLRQTHVARDHPAENAVGGQGASASFQPGRTG